MGKSSRKWIAILKQVNFISTNNPSNMSEDENPKKNAKKAPSKKAPAKKAAKKAVSKKVPAKKKAAVKKKATPKKAVAKKVSKAKKAAISDVVEGIRETTTTGATTGASTSTKKTPTPAVESLPKEEKRSDRATGGSAREPGR